MLLSLLGSIAIASAPISSFSAIAPQIIVNNRGMIKLDGEIMSSYVKGVPTKQKEDIVKKRIKISQAKINRYFNKPKTISDILWNEGTITIRTTLTYKNNLEFDSNKTIHWIQKFDKLDYMFFSKEVVYENDNANNEITVGKNSAFHKWSYILSEDGFDLIIDAKIWTSAIGVETESWATMSFDTMIYDLPLDVAERE